MCGCVEERALGAKKKKGGGINGQKQRHKTTQKYDSHDKLIVEGDLVKERGVCVCGTVYGVNLCVRERER